MDHLSSTKGDWHGHEYWVLARHNRQPFLVYSPTLGMAAEVNRDAWRLLSQGKVPEPLAHLFATKARRSVRPAVSPPRRAFHLGIGLTRNCTLACRYCHAEADKPVQLDWRVLAKVVAHAFSQAGRLPTKTLSVSFAVGGEPTMNWRAFTAVVSTLRAKERAREFGVERVFLSMTTNGYYGDKKRAYIGDNFDHLTLSLDGTPDIHNLHRPTRSGRGSYDLAAGSFRYFRSLPAVRTGIRSTVSSHSVSRLEETVQFFAASFGSGIAVSFEPLIRVGRAQHDDLLTAPDLDTFYREFRRAVFVGRELGVRVTCSGPSLSRLVTTYCGAFAMPSFAVCSNGKVTACHRDQDGSDYGYGVVEAGDDGRIVTFANAIERLERIRRVPSSCDTCFAKHNCAGDCPDLRRIGWSRCSFNREWMFDQIVDVLKIPEGGGRNEEQ